MTILRRMRNSMGICHGKTNVSLSPMVGNQIEKSDIHHSVILDSTPHTDVQKYYHFDKVLGHGNFGTVRLATSLSHSPDMEVAIKSVSKAKIKDDMFFLKRELDILMVVDHPNIIRYYESYEDDRYIHIVQELCTGGDILDRFTYAGPFNEKTVSELMRKIFSAVNHMHSQYICHRDIKVENFLFKSRDPAAEVKMIDFGMSSKFGKNGEALNTMVGAPNYLAPEMLNAKYGKECDVWSLGVMLFYLLSGKFPFEAETMGDSFRKITEGHFSFSAQEWGGYTPEVRDLITRMLIVDPKSRITLPGALKHKWFTELASRRSSVEVPRAVLTSLKKYKAPSKLQHEAMKIIVKHLSAKDIEDLDLAFKSLDKESTGVIPVEHLERTMKAAGLSIPPSGFRGNSYLDLVESMGEMQQGGIRYSSFLMAALDKKRFLDEEGLYMAFKHMDLVRDMQDNDGFITVTDLKVVFDQAEEPFSDQELTVMIQEFCGQGESRLGFPQFKAMMQGRGYLVLDQPSPATISASMQSRRSSVRQRVSILSDNFN